jgi:hypothetical protein
MTSFRTNVIGASVSWAFGFLFFLFMGRHFNQLAENYIDSFANQRPVAFFGGAGPAPFDPASTALAMTFDPPLDTGSQTTQVALNDTPAMTPVAFTYEAPSGAKPLQVAALDGTENGVVPDSMEKTAYSLAGRPVTSWQSLSGVPEPGVWALMLVGVGVLGGRLRNARRAPALV